MKLLINNSLLMSQREVDDLPEYSTTFPTGQTPGKAWKRRVPWNAPRDRADWMRGVYGLPYPDDHEHAGSVPIGWRPILIAGRAARFPSDLRVPARGMRGRIEAVVITPAAPPPAELPDGLRERDGRLWFNCRACDAATEWDGEAADFEDGHYANVCGGSPRCLP